MSSKPTWLLDEHWGVTTDVYNWMLLRRGKNKDGSYSRWRNAGYYASVEKLLMGFYRKLARTAEPDSNLIRHIEHCAQRVCEATARLGKEIDNMAWPERKTSHERHTAAREHLS